MQEEINSSKDLQNCDIELKKEEPVFRVLLQKIWLFYKTSEKHHKWDIYMP